MLPVLLAVGLPLVPERAEAYSTRVHIMIANRVREALIEASDSTMPRKLGDHAVVLVTADYDALLDYPLEFWAGAVGSSRERVEPAHVSSAPASAEK